VLAYNEATGENSSYEVTATHAHEDSITVNVTMGGELLETTPEHPFYTADNEWVAAGDLEVGDDLRRADGSYGEVQAIEFIHQPQVMYNLTVAEAHTFFVGDGQWLVHNICILGRVPYGRDSMSLAAQQFRLDHFREASGNVAVFQIQGQLPQSLRAEVAGSPGWLRLEGDLLVARNSGNALHSEQVLDALLTNHGVNHSNVAAVYSELSPCTSGNNCFSMLNESGRYRSQLPVTYSFQHPNEVSLQRETLRTLFERGTPGPIP
jgi:hypothetical protein